MSNIKTRIIEYAENKGFKRSKFPEKIGMTSASFRGESMNSGINSKFIENFLSIFPEVDLYWLLTGKKQDTQQRLGLASEDDLVYNVLPKTKESKDIIIEDLRFTIKTMNIAMEHMQARINDFEKNSSNSKAS